MESTIGNQIDRYYNLKLKIAEITQKQIEPLAKEMEDLKTEIQDAMDKENLKRASGKIATAYITIGFHSSVKGKKEFIEWIIKNNRYDLMPSSVNSGPIKEIFQIHNIIPDGVDTYTPEVVNAGIKEFITREEFFPQGVDAWTEPRLNMRKK